MAQFRESIQCAPSSCHVLQELAADRYEDLSRQFGASVLGYVEQQISLYAIDRCWADHLEHLAEIRESIHLFSMGGLDPFHEFQRQASHSYRETQRRIVAEIVAKFNRANITPNEIDLQEEGLLGPSSTWTYMINDHPAGDVFERFTRSVRRMLGRK